LFVVRFPIAAGGSSFSGLLTRVEIGHIRIGSAGKGFIRVKSDRADAEHLVQGERLMHALGLDMAAWFKPTAENYFGRVSRAQMLAAIDEARGCHAPVLAKLKKTELAARAESLVAETDWLPEPLRYAPKATD
jgi:hypothetical protein